MVGRFRFMGKIQCTNENCDNYKSFELFQSSMNQLNLKFVG